MTHKQTNRPIEVPTLCDDSQLIPQYASLGAAGADVRAAIDHDIYLAPGSSILVPTGLTMEIPCGYEIQIRPRSGLALKNQITVLNTPATIDSDYRGKIGVILINHGKETFQITPGMRIAQFVLCEVVQARFVQKEQLTATARGCGGFGHTGVN